jgi:hypothetical protein
VLDVACRQIVSNIIAATNNLIVREAKIDQPARNIFEWIIVKVPRWGVAGGSDAGVYARKETVGRINERGVGFDGNVRVGDARIV